MCYFFSRPRLDTNMKFRINFLHIAHHTDLFLFMAESKPPSVYNWLVEAPFLSVGNSISKESRGDAVDILWMTDEFDFGHK
jgi:hypothetical protein